MKAQLCTPSFTESPGMGPECLGVSSQGPCMQLERTGHPFQSRLRWMSLTHCPGKLWWCWPSWQRARRGALEMIGQILLGQWQTVGGGNASALSLLFSAVSASPQPYTRCSVTIGIQSCIFCEVSCWHHLLHSCSFCWEQGVVVQECLCAGCKANFSKSCWLLNMLPLSILLTDTAPCKGASCIHWFSFTREVRAEGISIIAGGWWAALGGPCYVSQVRQP